MQLVQVPEGFILGASASAEQTEGWSGKKPGQDSFMDAWFQREPNVWKDRLGPDVATDFMNRFAEDAALMHEFGITHYRTSINWSRFYTDYEQGIVDEEYAAHIDAVIDALLAAGVEPMLCLQHYELPQELFDRYDGWSSRHVVELFARYARDAFDRFGDRVKTWFTFNEPVVVPTHIFLDGGAWPHRPGETGTWLLWNYHKVLATARAVQEFEEGGYEGRIGCIINIHLAYPRSSSERDREAAHLFDLFYNRIYLDPLIKGVYPSEIVEICAEHGIEVAFDEDDLAVIANHTIQYLGVNSYFPQRVCAPRFVRHPEEPFAPDMLYDEYRLPGCEMNFSRGWEIYPPIMYDIAHYLLDNYGRIPWVVTENGMGVEGEEAFLNECGIVQDDYRIDFVSRHMSQLIKAVEEGAPCEGYMLWSFTDCISPRNAFKNRYGYVRVDPKDGFKRIPKKSAYWHKRLAESRTLLVAQ
ncbi:glycoside hydrolase family 1 protein [Olsenella sp. SW781]|uniref:glycoside hydrolase family 1 protein n=1 Tax=Olsenella sp. SW781 TaxID=2530046 RepID=UPI00143945EF|nr:glycoside hydrolase family 1 protein [Olsenella sp. SW781]NJE80970.1 glycoside hydrolase family 1 protein [Olsenella sp. SW781]